MTSLLDEAPQHTLGIPLGASYKICLYYLFPPVTGLIVYFVLLITDTTLVYSHIMEGNPRWGTVTLLLICCPAVATFMFTVSSPNLWPSEKPLAKENLKFMATQLWYFIGFPIAVSYKYVYQIFWAVEALCASIILDEERIENALKLLLEPSPLEMYFFLQAYLHSAPQILLQFYIILDTTLYREAASIQILSIATCLMRMAMITMGYQRFERRKVLGICYPWSPQQADRISMRYSQCSALRQSKRIENKHTGTLALLPANDQSSDVEHEEVFENPRLTVLPGYSTLDPSPAKSKNVKKVTNNEMVSHENDSDESEFENDHVLEFRKNAIVEDTIESDMVEADLEWRRNVSIVEDPAVVARRESREKEAKRFNIVDMSEHTTPPQTPAPRPMSIAGLKGKIISNAEAFAEKIPQRRFKDSLDFDVPIRVRRTAIKGIEQEDGVAKFLAFVAWLLFLTSRMLALATFSHFHPMEAVYICIAHYLLMLTFLMCNSWTESLHRKAFYLFLSYIYVFSLIEFKMTFRKVRLSYGLYFILITLQNFILTAVWYFEKNWEGWWYGYMAFLVIGSSILSYMCFLIYFLILKPKPRIVYPIDAPRILSETDC